VLQWLRQHGPFEPAAFARALSLTLQRLGKGRPLTQIIQALTQFIPPRKDTR
jgi:hypothetical protein